MFLDQQLFYSGHKKQHAIAHLAIVLPNGLFSAVFPGVPASGGDASLCIHLGLGQRLRKLLYWLPEGESRYVYGDAAFSSQDFVLGPYKRANGQILTPTQKKLNQWLSKRRIVVKHGFGGVKMSFKLLGLKTSLVPGLVPVGIYMLVFSFLYNCRTCIRGGNQILELLGMPQPSIKAYVQGRFGVESEIRVEI
ncbi:hypothetical protein K469DRAFT_667573 [Zopfia rhizophila CBS 207.26]|uniref:DDE Tnp4 domain-containing protein n=1 Tax=Zopfia rhizophila CBS 207.26 TaxID=1314779 RepID=A0A6A6DYK1_9PEZI|nr:hypothetical protein K469DRAFT_667573 [Zopfia rhizophila CBS 207.26]